MFEEDKKDISLSCRDYTVSSLFSLVRIFIYVLSVIAITNNSAEVIKNIWSVVK